MQTSVPHYTDYRQPPDCMAPRTALARADAAWSRVKLAEERRGRRIAARRAIVGAALLGTLLGIRIAIGPVQGYSHQAPAPAQYSHPLPARP